MEVNELNFENNIEIAFKNSIFSFEADRDINEIANIVTNGRFDNVNEVYIYNCPYCEGYGFINEELIVNDFYQYLYGELCLYCDGKGKLTFTEYFLNYPNIKN